MSNRRKLAPLLATIPITAVMGLNAFSSVASSPRFETFHTLDVIRLMAAGAACAGTLVGLIVLLVKCFGCPASEDKRAEEQSARESN